MYKACQSLRSDFEKLITLFQIWLAPFQNGYFGIRKVHIGLAQLSKAFWTSSVVYNVVAPDVGHSRSCPSC